MKVIEEATAEGFDLTLCDGYSDKSGTTVQSRKHKFEFTLPVDPEQNNRASEIRLFSFARPHMRAFHLAWWSYHVAFLMWFSISPLLTEVQDSLGLSKEQIWSSSIAAVTGTIVMRFLLGPFCDLYGPRIPMGIILIMAAIPTALTGLVQSATGLIIIRFFIGMGGSTFVMCQYWTSTMFTKEWVGTANATVGGWGNLGGGVTQILVGSLFFPLFREYLYDGDEEKAWRTVCVIPAMLGLATAFVVMNYSDDSPNGNYSKLKRQNSMQTPNLTDSFCRAMFNTNTWWLFAQYACCFGVEITMNNAAAMYFKEEYGLRTESAAAIASIFGWMNIFARSLGGFSSDFANRRWGMQGRLVIQSINLLMEGTMVVIFAYTKSLSSSILCLVFFSVFVQAAEGSTYGIVPYVCPPITGSISGIIGAGGNTGAALFGVFFQQMSFQSAFLIMGILIISSSTFSLFVCIPGHGGLLWSAETCDDGTLSQDPSTGDVDSPKLVVSTSSEATDEEDEDPLEKEVVLADC